MSDVYFIYSKEDLDKRTNMLKSVGTGYTPGTVLVNGKIKKYTEMVDSLDNQTLNSDVKLIIKGKLENITYTEPSPQY